MKLWRSVTSNLKLNLPLWLAALWWGSLTTLGFFVVPMLFIHLPTPAVAGAMAAKLFGVQTYLSAVCSGLMLILLKLSLNSSSNVISQAKAAIYFIAAGLILCLLSEFAIAPRIVEKENLRFWHSLGSAAYFLQWLCAGMVFAKLKK
jgi:hypothetical protein